MSMNIININDKNSLSQAANILHNGGILIFPTDTVYGIGCLMIDKAINKLYKIKNRPKNQPTAVLMTRNIFDNKRKSELVIEQDEEFLSGKLTIIDEIKDYEIDFPKIIIKDGKIGIRLPQYKWLEDLIEKVGPIVASSANFRGEKAPSNYNELNQNLTKQADLTIKTNVNLGNNPSRIYNKVSGEYLR